MLLALLCVAAPAQDSEAQLAEVARLDAQAKSLYQAGRYHEAIPLAERVVGILEKTLGPEHRAVALLLGNLASMYQAAGDYIQAELSCQRALTIFQKFGPESPEIAKLYGRLAVVYFAKGDRARAESTLGRALEIYRKTPDQNESEVAKLYSDLGVMYLETDDYNQAGAYFETALPIFEKTLGREHQVIAIVLNNLAVVARVQGDLARGESFLQRALAIYGMHNPEHPDITGPLINLALLYYDKGENDRAEPLYRRALNVLEKTLGPEHPEIAKALHNLGILYRAKKDYVHAESSFQRALTIREKKFGPEHPDVAQSLYDLAFLYYAEDDNERALEFLTRGNEVQERSLASVLNAGSEWQKQLYLNTLESTLHAAVSLNVSTMPRDERAARLALTTILQRKGRVVDTVAGQLTILRLHGTAQDQDLLHKLASLHSELTALETAGNQISPVERNIRVAVLSMAIERIEGELSRRSAEVGRQAPPISLKVVQQALPSDAALVEIFQYRPFKAKTLDAVDQWDAPRYVSYVIRSNESTPQWVDLGDATIIDAEVTRLRAALKDPRRTDSQTVGRALDERIMRPIRKLLGPSRRLFLSPDGTLNLIPFAALVDENGKYLVENYSLTYLTSGRDLLRLNVPTESAGAPVVIANPLYDLTILSLPGSSRDRAKQFPSQADAQRSMDFIKTSYSPLPGTADEALALKKLWSDARVLMQDRATEAALKQVNRPLVLHIATHGFFLADQSKTLATGKGTERTIDSFLFLPLPKRWENPLLRSGLILAGVNQQSSGPGEDGVLTAMEVAGLDLRGTKLVVLSACETAVGDVKTGEGVYGLRRALTLAGSETQVMSLWKVSDVGTRDLMTAYYIRLQKGEGRTEALRQVQLAMLQGQLKAAASDRNRGTTDTGEQLGTKDYRHPYFWAAFIQSGDWRSLDGKSIRAQ